MRQLTTGVFGSRLAVAITASIVTAVVVAGGIAVASVPNNSVGTHKIRDGAVRSADIRNGAVKGIDIRNGSVQTRDLAPAARASTAVADYNDTVVLVEASFSPVPGGNVYGRTTNCPSGTRVLAGGGSSNRQNLFMTNSAPADTGQGWSVRWETDDDIPLIGSGISLTVFALCAPNTGP